MPPGKRGRRCKGTARISLYRDSGLFGTRCEELLVSVLFEEDAESTDAVAEWDEGEGFGEGVAAVVGSSVDLPVTLHKI